MFLYLVQYAGKMVVEKANFEIQIQLVLLNFLLGVDRYSIAVFVDIVIATYFQICYSFFYLVEPKSSATILATCLHSKELHNPCTSRDCKVVGCQILNNQFFDNLLCKKGVATATCKFHVHLKYKLLF